MEKITAMFMVSTEVERAIDKFPPFRSPHEGLAIILEEYEELKAEVFKQHHVRDTEAMAKEATQVAAMALRFLMDLC